VQKRKSARIFSGGSGETRGLVGELALGHGVERAAPCWWPQESSSPSPLSALNAPIISLTAAGPTAMTELTNLVNKANCMAAVRPTGLHLLQNRPVSQVCLCFLPGN
jgi:hypothetical protein